MTAQNRRLPATSRKELSPCFVSMQNPLHCARNTNRTCKTNKISIDLSVLVERVAVGFANETEMEATVNEEGREKRLKGEKVGGFLLARPVVMLRVEGAALLAGSAVLYWMTGESWWLFALLLLVPDLSMLGYLGGTGIGAAVYNAFHSYPLPVVLGIFGLLAGAPLVVAVALVWLAHIGMDRTVGYGLKYAAGFKDTHLGRV